MLANRGICLSSQAPTFQIFILCRNRTDLLRENIKSWLTQDLTDTELIISDNSSNEDVAVMMAKEFPQIEVRKRRPCTHATDHFNAAKKDATATWFMLFHDDDVMAPGGFAAYKEAARQYPNFAAIAGNAYFMRNGKITSEKLNATIDRDMIFTNVADFASRYFHPVSTLQPLPGYLFNRAIVADMPFDFSKARKYSDFIYLTEIAERGPILWLEKVVMYYRVHGNNDSGAHDIKAVILARRRLIARGIFRAKDPGLELYRYWNYLLHMRAIGALRAPWRTEGSKRTIVLATWRYFLKHPLPLIAKVYSRLRHGRL